MTKKIIVGISGATGMILAYKTVDALIEAGYEVELVMTSPACRTAVHELGEQFGSARQFQKQFPEEKQGKIQIHPIQDIGSTIASGTYKTAGMVIVPCSIASVAAIAAGLGDNLLRRAADVTIKESRRLVLCVRESPLSTLHLENLSKLSSLGAKIIMPVPAWYAHPRSLGDVEDHIVGRILGGLQIESSLQTAWQGM